MDVLGEAKQEEHRIRADTKYVDVEHSCYASAIIYRDSARPQPRAMLCGIPQGWRYTDGYI